MHLQETRQIWLTFKDITRKHSTLSVKTSVNLRNDFKHAKPVLIALGQ